MKIMIVDDNQQIRQIIRAVIQPFHPHVFECENGAEAIQLYEKERPDCVLMDIEMQPMDGIAAATFLKQVHPEARIIFVTQHDSNLLRRAAGNCGADGYVLKENLTELNETLRRLFPVQ
jgi:CheY-like chemotaxis protein